MKSVIAEFAMDNELLRERIRRMEDVKPFLRCRSRKSAVPGRPPRSATTGASRVLKAWGLPRCTFYHRRRRQASPHTPAAMARGRASAMSNLWARSGTRLPPRPSRAKATARCRRAGKPTPPFTRCIASPPRGGRGCPGRAPRGSFSTSPGPALRSEHTESTAPAVQRCSDRSTLAA